MVSSNYYDTKTLYPEYVIRVAVVTFEIVTIPSNAFVPANLILRNPLAVFLLNTFHGSFG